MLWIAIVLAVLVGVSLGALGGGGSILTVPILRYVIGLKAHEAIAMSLFVVGTTSLAALIPHARRGCVSWRTGVLFGASGMFGAFLAGRVANWVPAPILLFSFAFMMLATALAMLQGRDAALPTPAHAPNADRPTTRSLRADLPLAKILLEGFGVGAVTGLVGAGGGFLVVPALVLLAKMPIKLAIGTSLLVIAMKSFAGFAGFLGHTAVDMTLGVVFSVAAVSGSVLGALLSARAPAGLLRASFGWFVVAMACFIFAQELPLLWGQALPMGTVLLLALVGTSLFALGRCLLNRKLSLTC